MQKTRRLSNLSRQLLASAAGVGAYGACHAMRQRRSFAVACAAEEATAPEAFPPAVIVGGGRLGEAFAKMGLRQDVIVRRGETFPSGVKRSAAAVLFCCVLLMFLRL